MPVGTNYSRAVPHLWHKKTYQLPLNGDLGAVIAEVSQTGTQNDGAVWGLSYKPSAVRNYTTWNMAVPGDWDGTSNFVFKYYFTSAVAGDTKDIPFAWDFYYWVCQEWDNIVGSKFVHSSATHTFGDEGTTNYSMHSGTFEMDLTGGTFGTVAEGHWLFMDFGMPQGAAAHGTAFLFHAQVEYMARAVGPGDAIPSTQQKGEA